MSEDITTLEFGSSNEIKYRVHPSVILSILEFFNRNKCKVVGGALLGLVQPNSIDITNAYPVGFEMTDFGNEKSLKIDKESQKEMFELNQEIYPKEVIVGWFITQTAIDLKVVYMHHYYSSDKLFKPSGLNQSPLLMTLDPTFARSGLNVKGYVKGPLSILVESFAQFQAVDIETIFFSEHPQEISTFINDQSKSTQFSLVDMSSADKIIDEILDSLKKMKGIVGSNKLELDVINRINSLLNLFPIHDKALKESLKMKNSKQMILLSYLSNLVKTHSMISEKINQV